jgi:DNA-binding PadR family transcriptional regulator
MILTKKQFTILKELNKRKSSGPELRKILKWQASNAAFYMTMNRLNNKRLISKKNMVVTIGFVISTYSITEYGKKCLKETMEFYKG